jgi:hypothetical protein
LDVSHQTVLVSIVQGYPPYIFVLIARKDLRNYAGVSEADDDKHDLHTDVENDTDSNQSRRGLVGSDDIVEEHATPEKQMGACIFKWLGDEKPATFSIGLVVDHVGDLVHVVGSTVFLTHSGIIIIDKKVRGSLLDYPS